eukprot:scaffold32404_cov77-Phaeocystis_antarctica.AAC.3
MAFFLVLAYPAACLSPRPLASAPAVFKSQMHTVENINDSSVGARSRSSAATRWASRAPFPAAPTRRPLVHDWGAVWVGSQVGGHEPKVTQCAC